MKYNLRYFLILLVFPGLCAAAQDISDLNFDRLRVEDGLHNSIVYRIIQDGNGVLWFALHDGIDKYNGYDFSHYQLYEEDVEMDGSNFNTQVSSLYQVSGSEFWTGSGSNVYRYDLKRDEFVTMIRGLSSGIEVNQIRDLYISPDSVCYIATNQGLFSYDIGTGALTDHTSRTASVLSLHSDGDLLWVGTENGILFLNMRSGDFFSPFREATLGRFFASVTAMSFFTDSVRGLILIGTRRSGLFCFDTRTHTIEQVMHPGMDLYHVRAIQKYMENYLVGLDGSGLAIFDGDLNFKRLYAHDEDNPYSLSSNGIYDIFVDNYERIWISTYGGGVNVFDPNKKPFHVYRHESNNRNSLRNNVLRSFLEVDGTMVFGTAKGVSARDSAGNWRHIPRLSEQEEAEIILSMCRDLRGNIWLGTFGHGIEIRTPRGQLLQRINTGPDSEPRLSTDYIYVIYEDSRSKIWIGGIRGGLMVYDQETGSISVFNSIQNVHTIIEDSEGKMMVGTLQGIVILQEVEGEFRILEQRASVFSDLKIRVFSMLETFPGEFWIGTEGSGLFHYNRMTGQIESISVEDGMPSNIVYGILEDDRSNLWLSTTAGLVKYDPKTRNIRTYEVSDGISGKDFNYGAYYRSEDGTMFFGGQNGVTWFNPEEIKENKRPPEVILTGIDIFGLDPDDPENPVFERNVNEINELQLKHNQNSFSLDFAAINYTASSKNRYQWKISGGEFGEGTWTPVSPDRKAVFTFIPPGEYQFRVIASNSDDYWNDEGKILKITISPPFWNTAFARIIYVLLILILFIALQRYIITFIKERQAKEKIQFFVNIAHDIRTPLTLISAPMTKLIKSSKLNWEEKEEVRVAVKNSDRLKSLLNQLLEFQKASLNKHMLKVSEGDVAVLVHEVLNNFQPLMDERMINVDVSISEEPMIAWMDSQKIEKILYNLVSNAIKYSHKGGWVRVKVGKTKDRVSISVIDEGRGIPARQQKEIFNRYFRAQNTINSRETGSGVGLMLSKKLIELHRGTIRFTSTEDIGSVFEIDFPYKKSAYRENEILIAEPSLQADIDEKDLEEVTFSQEYTVMVVEDNAELRHHIKRELSDQYNVLTAKNGKIAYQTILKLEVDLIVSDIMMPEMDGRQLCQKVRHNVATSHIPVILLTALNSIQDKIEGLEYGADAYIEKPFEMEHLKIRIANLLKARERLRQRFLDEPGKTSDQDIPNKPDQEMMEKLNNLVREHVVREDFNVMDMCRMVGMSRPVLYRKLKAYTGHSPQEYIIILRLNHATRLFREGRLSIKEVAYESGFTDPKYFSKCFKKHYGASPSAYIESKGEAASGSTSVNA